MALTDEAVVAGGETDTLTSPTTNTPSPECSSLEPSSSSDKHQESGSSQTEKITVQKRGA